MVQRQRTSPPHNPHPYPTITCMVFDNAMDPILVSCRLFLDGLRQLIDAVRGRDGLWPQCPAFAPKAVALRLGAGVRLVEAYLRRVLLLLALEMEPGLRDVARPMARPHGRPGPVRLQAFTVLDRGSIAFPDEGVSRVLRTAARQTSSPHPVALGRLYRRLDQLAAIAADPLGRARRLAFHLARSRPGPILAPDPALRPGLRWGTQTATTFNLMSHAIVTASRARPPPLAPRRTHWPTVTSLAS